MKKGTLVQSFLMFLVISSLTFLLMCTAIAKYIDPDASLQSYNQLLRRIDAMAEDPRIIADSMMLELSKGGGVLVFQKDVESLAIKYQYKEELGGGYVYLIIDRPDKCGDSACICYAETITTEDITGPIGILAPRFLLKPQQKIFCKDIDAKLYLNFYGCTDKIKKDCYKGDNLIVKENRDIEKSPGNVEHGLILVRNLKFHISPQIRSRTIEPEKRIPIALEQYGGYITLGFHTPLFTPWDKKKIDFYNLADRLVECANNLYCEIASEELKQFLPSITQTRNPITAIERNNDKLTLKHKIHDAVNRDVITLHSNHTPITWKRGVWNELEAAIDTSKPLVELTKFELQGIFNRVILKVGNDLYSVKYIGAEPFIGPLRDEDIPHILPRSLVIYASPFNAPAAQPVVPTPGTGGSLPGPHDPHLPPDI